MHGPKKKSSSGGNSALHGSMVLSPNGLAGLARFDSSTMSSVSLGGSLSSRSMQSLQSLPSLSIKSEGKNVVLSELEFAHTMPVFRRTKYDLFGMEDVPVYRKDWKVPAEDEEKGQQAQPTPNKTSRGGSTQKNFITIFRPSQNRQAGYSSPLFSPDTTSRPTSSSGNNKNLSNQKKATVGPGYDIQKKTIDPFMKTESERKEKLDNVQVKRRSSSSANDFFIKTKNKSPSRSPPKTPGTPQTSVTRSSYSAHQRALSFAVDEIYEGFSGALTGEGHSAPDVGFDSISLAVIEKVNGELADGVYEKYFGTQAALDFQDKYRKTKDDLEKYPEDSSLPIELQTPRTLYLRDVLKEKLIPLPLLLRKESRPLSLHLAHKGLGDERMLPVMKIVDKLPAIQTIDLSDNRLTDLSLLPLTTKLQSLTNLTHLDLSFNKIDDSSAAIMDYLRDESCQLRTLLLNGADVDDNECANIAEAIAQNKSIRTLGLAKNLIGQAELLNVVYPDLVTGGEALGEMLKVNTTLLKLDLSWNSIRLDSAIALAKCLEVNHTLKTLLLGYNAFGDMPSQVLGRALKSNKGLTELDLECNSINPKAATVLANAISFNDTLLQLNINGNTLGKIGAQALVAAIQRSSTESRRLQVSFINCDCTKDDENIFSAANPHGTWRMNLREPYGQMVAQECLYLANFKAGCRIVKLLYNGQLVQLDRSYVAGEDEGEAGAMKKFKLEEFYRNSRLAANELLAGNFAESSKCLNNLLSQFGFKMDEDTRLVVLRKTKDIWTAKAKREGRDDLQETFLYEIFFALFVINDTDMSGTMELDEFLDTLTSLGKTEYDADSVKRLMNEYDRDESGSIDANEFGNIMLNEFCSTEIPRGELVDASTGKPWEIPPTGNCVIQLSYQCDIPTLFDIGADHGIDNIITSIRNAKTDDQREILFQNTTSSPYFFLSFEQAQLLFEEMQGLNRLPLELMASILPQIATEDQAIKFVDTNLNDLGLTTAHYSIDMNVAQQRNGGRRLGAICVTEGKKCRQAGVNSSQKGNNSNFRNEKLGVMPVEITGKWFSTVTSQVTNNKTLHCDYVSTQKARKSTMPVTEIRFQKIVEQLQLEEIKKVYDRLKAKEREYLERQAEEFASTFGKGGNGSIGAGTVAVGGLRQIGSRSGKTEEDELDSLSASFSIERMSYNSRGSIGEGGAGRSAGGMGGSAGNSSSTSFFSTARKTIKDPAFSLRPPSPSLLTTLAGMPVYFDTFPELNPLAHLPFNAVKEAYGEYIETCHHYHDILPEERMRDVSRVNYNPLERPPTPEDLRTGPAPSKTNIPPIFVLSYRKVLEIQILMPYVYFNVSQLITLLNYFPPDEGYTRVMLLQSVFSHIVDIENLYLVIDTVFTVGERNEAFHRIGIMNLLDSMKPDRIYRLDLRRYDHREWVKILVSLAIAEPGNNWELVEYRWGKYDDPVPGWTLPATWAYEDDGGVTGGPRNHGWLKVLYRSYGNGCMPVMAVRKFLRKRTLAGMKRII